MAHLQAALGDRYRIDGEIGAGGMATVYLARDLKHDRRVAVKVLKPELGAVLGVERFLAEIKVTANLQHPNLLPLFDSGEADGQLFYVMPFVEGESLRARLDREKQLPIDEAVHIAVAIAGALAYAHAQGVIHRDLKPENILLQHGEPVVADFGIALAVSRAGGARITQTGLSLGTPQYMSPEQATGDRVIDGRTDIYSLGAVLYEMLAGEPPHTGSSAQSVIAKLMTDVPRPLRSLRRAVPANIEGAVARALEKLPADRWASAREFAEALSGERQASAAPPTRAASARLPWTVAGVSALLAIAALVALAELAIRRPTREQPTIRFPLVAADSERVTNASGIPFALSPDDRYVAYVGAAPAGTRLYIRDLQTMVTRPVSGSEEAVQPAFSPDGRALAFVAGDQIMRCAVEGGPSTPILSLKGQPNAGLVWADPDTIIASIAGSIVAVPVSGGNVVVLTRPDTAHGEVLQWGPRMIDHRYVAYISVPPEGFLGNRVAILDRRTKRATIASYAGTTILGAIDGRLLWITGLGAVMAATVDEAGTIQKPEPVQIETMLVGPGGAAKAAISENGSLIYRRGIARTELLLADDHGVGAPLTSDRILRQPRLSPDGSRVAVTVTAADGTSNIWVMDMRTKVMSKLTGGDGANDSPYWSPDGKYIFYHRTRPATLNRVSVDGSDSDHVVVPRSAEPWDGMQSHDGHWMVYRSATMSNVRHIYAWPLTAGGFPSPSGPITLVDASTEDVSPELSPDDRWLVYASVESGRSEVYVRPFPGPGGHVQISAAGGSEPTWSRNGRTIFYRVGRKLMAADLSFSPNPSVTARRTVFEGAYLSGPLVRDYDVTPDGKHFLLLRNAEQGVETVVVYGWAQELRKAWR